MHTVCRSLYMMVLALSLGFLGCTPSDDDEDIQGRPFDVSQQRLQSSFGDRWEHYIKTERWRPIRRGNKPKANLSEGDWNYQMGGTVTAGVALYNNAYGGGPLVASCTDRLFAATTSIGNGTNGTNNIYAFDNLFAKPPGSNTNCTKVTPADPLCTTTNGGWCPRRIWRMSLSGAVDRNSLTLSRDGKQVYAATNTGFLYALNGADGTKAWTNPFSAQAETGAANAGFAGSAPWVNYSDGSIYIAANYSVAGVTHIRLYKLKPTDGSVMYKLDISGDGISSSVIAYDAVYFGSTTGKLYRVADTGAALVNSANWPLQLWSEKSAANNGVQTNPNPLAGVASPSIAVFGAPSIDVTNSLLFVTVNNVFFSVNIATRAINWVEGGWQNGTEANANDVPAYSSPWADPALMTVFVGHGKDQSDTGGNSEKGPRCHRRDYFANGSFNQNTLTSVATTNGSADLSNPHSSPLVLHEPAPSTAIYVFIGDPGGTLNRWDYETGDFAKAATFDTGQGKSIESPIIIDYLAGNIYFGDDSGRVYQISQSSLK